VGRNRGGFDVVFYAFDRTIGFNLAQDTGSGRSQAAVSEFAATPGRAEQVVANADVTRTIDNLDAGMGYSRRLESVPNGYAYAMPGYTRAPGAIFMPAGKLREATMPPGWGMSPGWGLGQTGCSARFDGKIFVGAGPTIVEFNADGTSATTVFTGGAGFVASEMVVFNNRLYVAGGIGGLAYRTAGGGWTGPSLTVQCGGLATASWRPLGIPTQVMASIFWDSTENNWSSLRWCPITADPMTLASWSAPITVSADRRYQMGPIVAAPRWLLVYSRDGVYEIDELGTRAYNIAPWLAENQDLSNGLWGMHLGTGAYYAHSSGLAYVETSGETQYRPEWAQPGWGLPFEGPIRGLPTAGTLHAGWGLVGLGAGIGGTPEEQITYLCAGRRIGTPPGGIGPTHLWHGAEAVVTGAVTHMRTYTNAVRDGWPELLLLSHRAPGPTEIDRCYWQSLSKIGNPLQELIWGGQFDPADQSSLFLPTDAWNRPSAVKQLLQIDLMAERLNLGADVLKVWAAVDGAEYVEQGTADEYRYTSLRPSPALEGRYITTKVEMTGHPVLRSMELRAAMGIQLREARTYQLVLAWDDALQGARSRETADPERRMDDLRSLLGQVCYVDDGSPGGPYRVRVLQVQAGQRRRIGGARRAGAGGTEGAWAIVVPVTVSFLDLDLGFRWDGPAETDRFDVDRVWR
jgi:hypothetical protein